jgi:hypothetical protein
MVSHIDKCGTKEAVTSDRDILGNHLVLLCDLQGYLGAWGVGVPILAGEIILG